MTVFAAVEWGPSTLATTLATTQAYHLLTELYVPVAAVE